MSARTVTDYSLDAHLLDLDAVANQLNLQSFALVSYATSAPTVIAYAARHPERVLRLVIWSGHARAPDYWSAPRMQTLLALLDRDWEMFAEAFAQLFFGWGTGEPARWLARLMRESVSHHGAKAALRELQRFDVTPLLPQVRAQTLVLHQRGDPLSSVDISRELASTIPDARLVVVEETTLGALEAVLTAIADFLSEGEEPAAGPAPSGLVTILFTDIEGSTSLTQRLGDAKAQEILRTHNTIIRDALKAHSGSEVKHTGDGFMASFTSASRALECAIVIQRSLAQHNESNPNAPIRVRIGLNAGEPVAEEKDLFGTAVQLAARICAHADPGEIVAANVVRELTAGKGFLFADRGEVALRGFEDPVRLYQVRWGE